MKSIAWLFKWLLKAAIFFTLFAFALNNREDVTVHFFFGQSWSTPMVIVVLSAFSAGLLIGVLGMVPRWWRHRRAANAALRENQALAQAAPNDTAPAPNTLPPHGI